MACNCSPFTTQSSPPPSPEISEALAKKLESILLIGDVAFENRTKLEQYRQEAGDEWDDDEIYFVIDELRRTFPSLTFGQVSYCAGILTLARSLPV